MCLFVRFSTSVVGQEGVEKAFEWGKNIWRVLPPSSSVKGTAYVKYYVKNYAV